MGTQQRPEAEPAGWQSKGRQGQHRIIQAYGNDIELSVALDLTKPATRDVGSARSVLNDVWAYLWKVGSEDGTCPALEDVGILHHGTMAVVEVDRPFEAIIPQARTMQEEATKYLGGLVRKYG